MRPSLSFGLAALATSLANCSQVYYTRPGSGALRPATAAVAPADRTAVWQRAVVALLEQGYVPQILNEAAGYISARRREDISTTR
jgi:hypothetical protein